MNDVKETSGGDSGSSESKILSSRAARKKSGPFWVKLAGVLLVLVVVAAVFGVMEKRRQMAEKELARVVSELEEVSAGSQEQAEGRGEQVLVKVRELIDLPSEPQPAVATVTDVDRLRGANPFFQQAKNGDILVLTVNRAILYDETRHKIIDVAPLQLQPGPVDPTPPTTEDGE